MANFSAIMVLFRFRVGVPLIIIVFLTLAEGSQTKSKRQIYREQVLPASGGKIPEGAFRTDRLALNRLNKEGIAVPDGVLFEHRHVHGHPHEVKHDPEDEDSLIKIVQSPDGRFTAPEGTYHNERPRTVASTYLIRKPIGPEDTNIRTPDQQTPLHEIILHGQHHRPQRPHYGPPNYHPPPPVVYQRPPQPQHHLRPYYPIPVQLELPNKEVHKEQFYAEQYDDHSFDFSTADIHDDVDWSYLLGRYTQLADEINNGIVPQDSYRYSTPHSSFYFSSEVAPGYGFHFTNRYPRKSGEATSGKNSHSRKLVRLRCNPGVDSKCQVFQLCQKSGSKVPSVPCSGEKCWPSNQRIMCLDQEASVQGPR